MDCKNIELVLIDYLEGSLPDKQQKEISDHIESCESCSNKLIETKEVLDKMDQIEDKQPSQKLKQNFYSMIEEEKALLKKEQKRGKTISISVRKTLMIAAQIVVFMGIGIAIGWYSNQNTNQPQLAQLNQKIDQLSQQVYYASLNQPTASERIKVINQVNTQQKIDEQMLDALINTMNGDENVNVRLTAIYALSDYKHVPKVKDAFIESLKNQNDPILQITLINIMITLNDSKVKPVLKDIIDNEQIDDQVKEQAKQGLSVQI